MKRMKRLCALLPMLCIMFVFTASAEGGSIIMHISSNQMEVNGRSIAIDADAAVMP